MATNKPEVGAYYKHQDGGFYRVTGIAKNTDDGSEMVIYSHLYPFESGAMFARPANQWSDVRFRLMSLDALIHFMDTHDRYEYQAEVTNRKCARKQKECDHSWWTVVSCASYHTRQCYKCRKQETIDRD